MEDIKELEKKLAKDLQDNPNITIKDLAKQNGYEPVKELTEDALDNVTGGWGASMDSNPMNDNYLIKCFTCGETWSGDFFGALQISYTAHALTVHGGHCSGLAYDWDPEEGDWTNPSDPMG